MLHFGIFKNDLSFVTSPINLNFKKYFQVSIFKFNLSLPFKMKYQTKSNLVFTRQAIFTFKFESEPRITMGHHKYQITLPFKKKTLKNLQTKQKNKKTPF